MKADNGGLRFNDGKPRYDLISPEFMDALAEHCRIGVIPHGERNWERGMPWCACFASLMRHAWAWMRGRDMDHSGSHHMIAVAWNAMVLYTYAVREIGVDDRPIKKASDGHD